MDTLFFGFVQSTTTMFVAAGVFATFVLLLIPSMMVPGAKPDAATKAIFCYMFKSFGVILMAYALVPMTYSILTGGVLPGPALSGLSLLLIVGVGIVLHFNRVVGTVDKTSAAIAFNVFSYGFEAVGIMVSSIAFLSLMLSVLLKGDFGDWETSATYLVLGLVLSLSFSLHKSPMRSSGSKMMFMKKKSK